MTDGISRKLNENNHLGRETKKSPDYTHQDGTIVLIHGIIIKV